MALQALFLARTSISSRALEARVGWTRGHVQFEQDVVNALCGAGLAHITPKGLEITKDGLRLMQGGAVDDAKYQGVPAAPRTAIANRPLRSRSPMVVRAGAMDYRDVPSVMGGVRYDYRTGAPLVDA
jgi:hypothetical protein